MKSLFQAIGIVFLIGAIVLASILSLYLLYITAIGLVIFSFVFLIYHFIKALNGG